MDRKYNYFYAAVTVEKGGKYNAYVIKFADCDNVLYTLNPKGCIHANVYKTKKEAYRIADFWNECYKRNGTYLFDDNSVAEA